MVISSSRQNAIEVLSKYLAPSIQKSLPPTITDFARKNFYIPETNYPLQLMPHQSSILEFAFDPKYNFQTVVYSTIKKSGKTAIGALVARWVCETWGTHPEVLLCANDYEQARGRIYQKVIESIELTPGYLPIRRELPNKWKIVERQAIHHPNHGTIRSVSGDYKGEAGSNPNISIFSELWAYESEASRRLWEELTPVPTRERSVRFVETYAGYEDSSDLLLDLYKLGKQGRQLTHDDIDWPFPDRPPIWVNERARMFMYWDEGIVARRMPWQTLEYYAGQEQVLRPQAFRRLHLNEWTTSTSPFIPIEWWINCTESLPPLDATTPIVIGADAAVSSDCCAIVGISRHPKNPENVAVRFSNVWYPPAGGTINLTETMEKAIKEYCAKYNIVQVAYDEYQLHKLMTDLTSAGTCWCRKFSQQSAREIADKQLYDLIRDRRIAHNGDSSIGEHLSNAAARVAKDEDTRLRIIKKSSSRKIDLTVAMSMATSECLRLIL